MLLCHRTQLHKYFFELSYDPYVVYSNFYRVNLIYFRLLLVWSLLYLKGISKENGIKKNQKNWIMTWKKYPLVVRILYRRNVELCP